MFLQLVLFAMSQQAVDASDLPETTARSTTVTAAFDPTEFQCPAPGRRFRPYDGRVYAAERAAQGDQARRRSAGPSFFCEAPSDNRLARL